MTKMKENGQMSHPAPANQARSEVEAPKERSVWLPAWAVDLAIMALILISVVIPMPGGGPAPGGIAPGGFPVGLPGLPGQGPGVPEHHVILVGLALAMVVVVLIPLRRRWPLPVFIVSLLLYISAIVVGLPAFAPALGAVVAVFALANSLQRVRALSIGAFSAVIIAVLSLFTNDRMVLDPQIFQIAAAIAIATALGDSARSRREYTRAAMERAERAEQTREAEARSRVAEERLRIAQDLHDTVAHRISVISLNAGVASSSLENRPEKAKEALVTIRSAARDVLGDIGVLLRYLRADGSGQQGSSGSLAQMVQPGLNDLDALMESINDMGLQVEQNKQGDMSMIDETNGRVVYRVVQEGLTNAHKHGSQGIAWLDIEVISGPAAMVKIQVSNPVSDSARNQPDAPQGYLGLTGLRERVGAVNGTITAVELDGTFNLSVELPLSSHARERHARSQED